MKMFYRHSCKDCLIRLTVRYTVICQTTQILWFRMRCFLSTGLMELRSQALLWIGLGIGGSILARATINKHGTDYKSSFIKLDTSSNVENKSWYACSKHHNQEKVKFSTKATNTDKSYCKTQRDITIEFNKELHSIENWLDGKEMSIMKDQKLNKNEFKNDKDFVKLAQELESTQNQINDFKIKTIWEWLGKLKELTARYFENKATIESVKMNKSTRSYNHYHESSTGLDKNQMIVSIYDRLIASL